MMYTAEDLEYANQDGEFLVSYHKKWSPTAPGKIFLALVQTIYRWNAEVVCMLIDLQGRSTTEFFRF